MGVEVTNSKELPVVFVKYVSAPDPTTDVEITLNAVASFKHEKGGHVYRCINILDIELNFGDMVSAMGLERGREGGADDKDVTTVFVAKTDIAKLGTSSLRDQSQYGQADVHMFNTVDEALDFVRDDIKKRN
jgi:hypothetical protein